VLRKEPLNKKRSRSESLDNKPDLSTKKPLTQFKFHLNPLKPITPCINRSRKPPSSKTEIEEKTNTKINTLSKILIKKLTQPNYLKVSVIIVFDKNILNQ
jgi:hypothetical protein